MPSIEKVRVVLGAVRSSQNRAFLATVFACGLRIQEARHLEVYDIESQRTMVHAHRGKRANRAPAKVYLASASHAQQRPFTAQRSEPSI